VRKFTTCRSRDEGVPACFLHDIQGALELGIEVDGGGIGGFFSFSSQSRPSLTV